MKNDSTRTTIEKTYRHDNPFVSPEKRNAGIFKELDNYHRTLKLTNKLQRVNFCYKLWNSHQTTESSNN